MHHISIRMAKIKIIKIPNARNDTEKVDHLRAAGENVI